MDIEFDQECYRIYLAQVQKIIERYMISNKSGKSVGLLPMGSQGEMRVVTIPAVAVSSSQEDGTER